MYFYTMTSSSFIVLLVYGFLFAWLTIPRVAEIVRKYKIFRKPSGRDLHWRFVPKLTGLSFYVALLVVAFAFVPFVDVRRLILVLGAGAIIIYVGIRDDIFQLSPFMKLILQLIAVSFFVFGDDLVVRNLYGFVGIYELPIGVDYFLTFFVGIFMINAFNLCDGIDGLAGMMGIVISACYGIIFYILGDFLFLSFCVILIGSLFAFLRYNIPNKDKVFMGDTGSLFLGFMFLLFTLYFVTDRSAILEVFVPHKSLVLVAALTLFLVPILDSGSVFFVRLWQRKSPFTADNNHVHHLVLHFTKSHIKSSLLIIGVYTLSIFGFSQLAFTVSPETTVDIFFAYIIVWYVAIYFLRKKVRSQKAGLTA